MALTSQQQAIQNQIDGFDSNTGTQVLLSTLLRAIDAGDIRQGYTDSAAFPTNDSDFIGFIGYDEFDSSLRYIGRDLDIHKIDSATASVGAAAAGQNVQGTASGYTVGGLTPPSTYHNVIDKFSYVSNANATDVGDLTFSGSSEEMTASPTHTYIHAGYLGPPGYNYSGLEKFPFATDANSADTSTTTPAERNSSSHNGPGFGYQIYNSKIHKINHASDTFTADAGSIPSPVETSPATKYQSYTSSTDAYSGNYEANPSDPFVKIAFASDTATASSARSDQTYGTQSGAANFNSDVAGYAAGGNTPPSTNATTAMVKFIFASEAEMTSVGTFAMAPHGSRDNGGSASTTYGYGAGGRSYTAPNSVATTQNAILNTPFSSDAPASDVGDLTVARAYLSSVQSQV